MSTTGLLRSMKAKFSGGQSKSKPGSSGENKQEGPNPGKQNATPVQSQSSNATTSTAKLDSSTSGSGCNQVYDPIRSREDMLEAYKGESYKTFIQTGFLVFLKVPFCILLNAGA